MLIGYFNPYKEMTGTIEFTEGIHHGHLIDVDECTSNEIDYIKQIQ